MIAIDHLSVLSKHELDQRLHGLSGVGIDYPCSGWTLGGSKTRMESSASKDTLIQISGAFTLLEPPFHFFFGSDFATASSSSSAPATASSLAYAQYLIQTNYITILIRLLGCHL